MKPLTGSDRWHRHSLRRCLLELEMSKDPSTKVGAVIVGSDLEVRSTGFNGLPRGIDDSYERLINRDLKYPLVVHAELNAILNSARMGLSTKGTTLYFMAKTSLTIWGGVPCTRCVVEMIQAGIKNVISIDVAPPGDNWRDDQERAKATMIEAGMVLTLFPLEFLNE